MNKNAKRVLMIIIVFIVCFTLMDWILNRWNVLEQMTYFQKWEQGDINKITTILNGVLSFAIANVMNFLKLYLDNKKDIKKEVSKISILINNVTGIKKTKRKDGLLEVNMGEGSYFVYVNSTLKNVGQCAIVECYINEKKLGINSLTKDECYSFCFKVCRGENENFKKSYEIKLKFRDDRERYYEKMEKLEINEERREAKIISIGKQKKRRK